jgi:hypothetical protein
MMNRVANNRRLRPSCGLAIMLLAVGAALGGCASAGDGFASGAFVDPAKYELYDCKQLETERRSLAAHTAELQKLIDKADTGVAGPVVAVVAYRNDYITTRASAKLADEVWQRDKCTETLPAAAAAPAKPGALPPSPGARPGGARAPGRSSGAVY